MNSLHLLHLDSNRQRLAQGEALALPSLRLTSRYCVFADAEIFATELAKHTGPMLILLHENDRPALLNLIDLGARMLTDECFHLVLYSGGWGWGKCEFLAVKRHTRTTLPHELWRQRWAAFPWEHITGEGRPLGWIARQYLALNVVCADSWDWRDQAARRILTEAQPSIATDFHRRFATLLGGLLLHAFNTDGAHGLNESRRIETRLADLLTFIDQCWLLEGLALSRSWPGIADRLRRAREAVEGLIGRPPSTVGLSDADQRSWAPTVCVLEAIRDEPVGES